MQRPAGQPTTTSATNRIGGLRQAEPLEPGRQVLHPRALASSSAAPSRSATIVASVTTIDGSRRYATSDAVERAERGAASARDDEHADASARPPSPSTPASDAADGEHRADRDVDLAGEDHERHAERDDQHRQVGEEQIAEVLPREVAGRGDGEQGGERRDRGTNRHFTTMSRQHGEGLSALGARRSALGARRSALGARRSADFGDVEESARGGDDAPWGAATPVRRFGCRRATASRIAARPRLYRTSPVLVRPVRRRI